MTAAREWGAVAMPVALLATCLIYLPRLAALGSHFNDLFAIPITVVAGVLASFEAGRAVLTIVRRRGIRQRSSLRLGEMTEVRLGALVCCFVALFQIVSFIPLSFAFLAIAPIAFGRRTSNLRSEFALGWLTASGLLSGLVFLFFRTLLGVPLRGW